MEYREAAGAAQTVETLEPADGIIPARTSLC